MQAATEIKKLRHARLAAYRVAYEILRKPDDESRVFATDSVPFERTAASLSKEDIAKERDNFHRNIWRVRNADKAREQAAKRELNVRGNPEAHRRRLETRKKYRAENKDVIRGCRQVYKANVGSRERLRDKRREDKRKLKSNRWVQFRWGARSRDLAWEITREHFDIMCTLACFYCDRPDSASKHKYMGLDRVDNNGGYIEGNAVPCCKLCNVSKRDRTVSDFWRACRAVIIKDGSGQNGSEESTYSKYVNQRLKAYKKGATSRGFAFNITDELALHLFSQPCYYCAAEAKPLGGIDRKKNAVGYEPDNVVPCCKTCNLGKGPMDDDAFIDMCARVYAKHPDGINDVQPIEQFIGQQQ